MARAALVLRARRVLPVHWGIGRAWVEGPAAVAHHVAGTPTEAILLQQGATLDLQPPD